MARKSAFDPARLDNEIDDLLPPPAAAPMKAVAAVAVQPVAALTGPLTSYDARTKTVPARIPVSVYDDLTAALAGRLERPSYAQIVAWACATYPDQIIDELSTATAAAAHAFRGRRSATSTVTITPRYRDDELRALDQVIDRAAAKLGSTPTRTAATLTAIRAALQAGIPTAAD